MTVFRSRRAALGAGLAGMAAVALGRPRIAMSQDNSNLEDAYTVLQDDGRFTQLLTLIDYANMEQRVAHPRMATTLFAPTDEAFTKYPYAVRNLTASGLSPAQSDPFGMSNIAAVSEVLRTHAVAGLHPPSEFSGRKVTLTNIAGTPIEVDGTDPNNVTVRWSYRQPSAVPVSRASGVIGGTPLQARRALIYPITNITMNTY